MRCPNDNDASLIHRTRQKDRRKTDNRVSSSLRSKDLVEPSGLERLFDALRAKGLGENIVQGWVNPDDYYVFKPTLKQGFKPILQKTLESKEFKLIYDTGGGKMVKKVPVPPDERVRFAIGDEDILALARWACLIEDHYCAKRGFPVPMDIERAKDGKTGELLILQARSETVQSRKNVDAFEVYHLKQRGPTLAILEKERSKP